MQKILCALQINFPIILSRSAGTGHTIDDPIPFRRNRFERSGLSDIRVHGLDTAGNEIRFARRRSAKRRHIMPGSLQFEGKMRTDITWTNNQNAHGDSVATADSAEKKREFLVSPVHLVSTTLRTD